MYGFLAVVVDMIHALICALIISGYFMSEEVRIYHSTFLLCIFPAQFLMGFNCPLNVLAEYFRYMQDDTYVINSKPFISKVLEKSFNMSISKNIIVVMIILMATVAMWQLMSINRVKRLRSIKL